MSLTTGDGEPGESRGAERATGSSAPGRVTFNRLELNRILNLYGRMVADGEWRDYAIDFLKDRAVFSIFRRASEVPIYRIEKDPQLARKQGAYSVVSATGHILRRGHELDRVLLVIDRKLSVVSTACARQPKFRSSANSVQATATHSVRTMRAPRNDVTR